MVAIVLGGALVYGVVGIFTMSLMVVSKRADQMNDYNNLKEVQ